MRELRDIYLRTPADLFAFYAMILTNIAVIVSNIFLPGVEISPTLATMTPLQLVIFGLAVVLLIASLASLATVIVDAIIPESDSRDGRPAMTASSIKTYTVILLATLVGVVVTNTLDPSTVLTIVGGDLFFLIVTVGFSGGLKDS